MTVPYPKDARRDPEALFAAAVGGERLALARLVSFVETGGEPARQIGRLAARRAQHAYSIGITGAPGAGKSTLTDRLIVRAKASASRGSGPATAGAQGASVGVLAIDPTSPFTGGAILGDRVRMQDHALDSEVFIRSMATRGHLGGLSLAVPEALRLLSAVGCETVLVETVGVGQVEVEVAGAADTTVVVLTPGWGDAVQTSKAGLMEVADVFVINKADRPRAREARRDVEAMLAMAETGGWRPPVVEAIATDDTGIDAVWSAVCDHRAHQSADGSLARKRSERLERELRQIVAQRMERRVDELVAGGSGQRLWEELLAGDVDPYTAADRLVAALTGGAVGALDSEAGAPGALPGAQSAMPAPGR